MSTPDKPGSPESCVPSPSASYQTRSPIETPVTVIDAVARSSSPMAPLSGVESGSIESDADTSATLTADGAVTTTVMSRVLEAPLAIVPTVQTPVELLYDPADAT